MKYLKIVYINLRCLIKNEIKFNTSRLDTILDDVLKNRYAIRSNNG